MIINLMDGKIVDRKTGNVLEWEHTMTELMKAAARGIVNALVAG